MSELLPAEVRPSAHPWPGEGGAVLQCRSTQILLVILLAQGFSEKLKLVLFRLTSSKKSPHNPPDFWKRCYELIGLSEYGFTFGKTCLQPKKTEVKKRRWKKYYFFKLPFSHGKKLFFLNFFFLFLMSNSGKFMIKKKKVEHFFLHGKKDGESLIGYTFLVGYIPRRL
jgi:hypothetical protein